MICEWLDHNPDLPDTIEGQRIARLSTKTRVEEYWFVHDLVKVLQPGRVLDAATGYVETWHVLPYILGEMGWAVETMDIDPRTLKMHEHPRVHRILSDLVDLPYPDSSFDVVTCISTLEHLSQEDRKLAVAELSRVLKLGGLLILTADNYPGVSPVGLAVDAGPQYCAFEIEPPADEDTRFPNGKRVALFAANKRDSATVAL